MSVARLPLDTDEPCKPIIDQVKHEKPEQAIVALGCFWSTDARYGILNGVISTEAGYCGGSKQDPSYHDIGDHIESVRIIYNPAIITFRDLMVMYWKVNSCIRRAWRRQYSAAVFYHDDRQREIAYNLKIQEETKNGADVPAEIVPVSPFYPAEANHQKYHLRKQPSLLFDFQEMYQGNNFTLSTAAARVNGFAAGYGSLADLERSIYMYGLSREAREHLLTLVLTREKLQGGNIRKCA